MKEESTTNSEDSNSQEKARVKCQVERLVSIRRVVSFSGGKDSTALLIRMVAEGMPFDDVVFCDTGKEFPAMYEHIAQVEKYLGISVTVLRAPKTFEYYLAEHIKVKGKMVGQAGYGWPDHVNRWCTNRLKQKVVAKYLRQFDAVEEYHGIAVDEAMRATKNKGRNIRYPLLYWGMTEDDCLKYCYDLGFDWGGLYEIFDRVSCYCCPLQPIGELRTLHSHFPELWQDMKDMDAKSWRTFKDNNPLDKLERRFEMEKSQMSLFPEAQPKQLPY